MSEQSQYSSFADYQESSGSTAVTEDAVRNFISGKAGEDAAFRDALLKDPAAVVEAEIGIKLPAGLSLKIHQETNDELHLVLPAPVELTAGQLEAVSGGWPSDPPSPAHDDPVFDADFGHDVD